MDQIAEKGLVESFHCGLVYTSQFSVQEAVTIPEAKAAVDKEWNTFMKVRPKSDVIRQAKKDGKTIHFASLMDLCHLKNVGLAKLSKKIQGASCAARRQR